MAKMTIMVGLPASGKSTRAEEIMRTVGGTVRINKDLLRNMLHFGKFTGHNEGLTRDAARSLATMFLKSGVNVIIDDTNLNPGTLQSWKDLAKELGATVAYERMLTVIDECIKRDAMRENSVGRSVIVNMALQNDLYPKPKKGFVLVDIDGTVADTAHRSSYVKQDKKDWKGFFSQMHLDTPREEVIDMVMAYEGDGYDIVFVSGRPDSHREVTETWLEKTFKGYPVHKTLIMRRANDSRADDIVKQEIYDAYFKDKYPVHAVIDDRPSVIRMWRANGLEVIDVGDGEEF